MAELQPQSRQWWPHDYADECMPEGRATPDAWLCRLDDGAHAYGIPGDREPYYQPRALAEGAVVPFMWSDDLGEAVLTFAEDGTYTCTRIPEGDVYLHVLGDPEMGADTVDYLVQCLREFGDVEDELTLVISRSSGAIPFRFTAQDGPPRFVAVDPAAV